MIASVATPPIQTFALLSELIAFDWYEAEDLAAFKKIINRQLPKIQNSINERTAEILASDDSLECQLEMAEMLFLQRDIKQNLSEILDLINKRMGARY